MREILRDFVPQNDIIVTFNNFSLYLFYTKGGDIVFVPKMSFWLVQNPSEERFPTSGNDRWFSISRRE